MCALCTVNIAFVCSLLLFGYEIGVKGSDITELQYLNTSVDPCDNFYEFTCGNFKNVHPKPEDRPLWDHFQILQRDTHNLIKFILESPRKTRDPIALQKAKTAYRACTNTEYSEELVLPEVAVLERAGGWPVVTSHGDDDVDFSWNEIGNLVAEYGIQLLFNIQVTVNPFNVTEYILYLGSDPLSNPSMVHPIVDNNDDFERVDYLNAKETDRSMKPLPFEVFMDTIALTLRDELGTFKPDAAIFKDVGEVLEFMRTLQKGGIPPAGDVDKLGITPTLKSLQNWTDTYFDRQLLKLDWVAYLGHAVRLAGVTITEDTKLMAPTNTNRLFYGILNLVARTKRRVLKSFAYARVLTYTAPDSDSAMREAFDTFYKELNLTIYPRDEYCIRKVLDSGNIGFSMALTYEYQRYHFNINKLPLAVELIEDLKDSFRDILIDSDWMDDATRAKALQKVAKMIILLGYPDHAANATLLDEFYENLRICGWDHFGNAHRLRAFRQALQFSFLRKPVDKASWMLSPLEPNAYYNKQNNRILLPVIMLNPVFFNGHLSILDYGRLGAIIGHEITHGYDSRGKLHDGDGNSNEWWSPATNEAYNKKAECFREQYDAYAIDEIGKHVNGTTTLDENLADNGGLREAYKAFEKLAVRNFPLSGAANYTPEQLFFIGFGTMWCMTETEKYLDDNVSGAYAPGRFRVNGPVSNMEEFAKAFDCPIGSNMNPERKCILW